MTCICTLYVIWLKDRNIFIQNLKRLGRIKKALGRAYLFMVPISLPWKCKKDKAIRMSRKVESTSKNDTNIIGIDTVLQISNIERFSFYIKIW